jgi:hypothetical protein
VSNIKYISGTVFKVEEAIKAKLAAAGATSKSEAVTTEEADFNMQEMNWISYVAGGLFATVKKTGNKYYLAT